MSTWKGVLISLGTGVAMAVLVSFLLYLALVPA